MKTKHHFLIFILLIVLSFFSFFVDKHAFGFVEKIKNPFFDALFGYITNFGNIFVVLILVTSLFLWQERKKEWIPTLWISYGAAIIVSFLIKISVQRPRPFFKNFYPLINLPDYAFPSMHAVAAFAAIPVLDREFPKLKWFWILFALLILFSRVYLRVHYLSDVIFGALIGYAIGWIFMEIEIKHKIFKRLKWI